MVDLQLRKPREVRQREEARAAVAQVNRLQPCAIAQPVRQRDEARAVGQVKFLQLLQFAQPLRQRDEPQCSSCTWESGGNKSCARVVTLAASRAAG